MKKDLNYNEAFEALQLLVSELEDGELSLELLPGKIKEATSLIAICDAKLRTVTGATTDAMKVLGAGSGI